jgi:hypothetical protein
MQRNNVAAATLMLISVLTCGVSADEAVKSGPQTGTELGESFEPLNVTGEHAGEKFCLVCDNGLSPVVMIFAREPNDTVMELLRRVDAATITHHAAGLGSFVVFLSEKEGLDKQLTQAAQKNGFKRIVLSIDAPKGPDGYSVAKDADVTVVLYVNHKVKANHAFRQGQLTGDTIDKIMADLPKILPAK